jgi:transposase-like protein
MAELTAKQLQVALLLAGGATITDAAKQVGVSRITVHQWLQTNIFKAHLNGLKKESVKAAISQIQSVALLAVTTLNELMASSKNDTVRLSCALKVLEMTHVTDRAYHIGSSQVETLDKQDADYL